jgi:hypothetical protein
VVVISKANEWRKSEHLTLQTSKNFLKKVEYLKDRINKFETIRKKNIRDFYRSINEFKKCYQHTANIVKDENCNLSQIRIIFGAAAELLLSGIECTWEIMALSKLKYIQPSHYNLSPFGSG